MQVLPSETTECHPPLCVDLDGTLIKTDLLWESLAALLRRNPLALFHVPFWWARGRAHLKQQLAARVRIDPATLPYHEEFLAWLKAQKRAGRKLILATASDIKLAGPVAEHVGLFDEVMASDGKINLRANAKLFALSKKFGERGFDYAGNSSVDLAVWKGTREAIVVNAGARLAAQVAERAKVGRTFHSTSSPLKAFLRCLRPHQWIKNLIIFVPVLTAHKLGDHAVLATAALAFVAFCLCASSVYMVNDLVDLEADRHHATKRHRPFAAGELPLSVGFISAPLLLVTGISLALGLSAGFAVVIAGYFVAALGYSLQLKQVAILDVFLLAGLYTLRLVAGHVATNIEFSSWLLMFSMFIFLSLALMKRFQELHSLRQQNQHAVKGRGYTAHDLELVTTLGLVSGFIAVLVLALYVNSEQVVKLYARPKLLLLVCPLMLYWISRVWFFAHRGQMHDDPTAFAFKDWVSYVVAAFTFAVMWLATGY